MTLDDCRPAKHPAHLRDCVWQLLALLTWRDFGWRLHSRLGVDFRRKGASERRRLHSAQAIFVTLVKFDVMWEVSRFVVMYICGLMRRSAAAVAVISLALGSRAEQERRTLRERHVAKGTAWRPA